MAVVHCITGIKTIGDGFLIVGGAERHQGVRVCQDTVIYLCRPNKTVDTCSITFQASYIFKAACLCLRVASRDAQTFASADKLASDTFSQKLTHYDRLTNTTVQFVSRLGHFSCISDFASSTPVW